MWGLGAAGAGAAILTAVRALRRQPPLFVRGHLEPAQFDVCFALGQRIYVKRLKKPYPRRDQADGWLDHFRNGVFQAYDHNDRCWGYLSLWPLTPIGFQKIKTGEATEAQLTQPMIAEAKNAPFTHWYVADILKDDARFHPNVSSAYFSDYLCSLMIFYGLRCLLGEHQLAFPFEMIGCAVTPAGTKWLKKFHFQQVIPASKRRKIDAVYIRTLTHKGVLTLLKQLRRTIKIHESKINKLIRNS